MSPLSEFGLLPLLPTLAVIFTAVLVLVQDAIAGRRGASGAFLLTLIGLAVSFYWTLTLWGAPRMESFRGGFVLDRFSLFFDALLTLATFATVLMARCDEDRGDYWGGEFLALILFAASGMMIMASSNDLIVVFLGLETMSIAVYVLAGIRKKDAKSNEAALKYFILGAFASGFLLYGIALLYGATGTTRIEEIAVAVLSHSVRSQGLLYAGTAFLVVGLGFKVALVPFHSWVPDVYQGSPTAVTALMAVAVKAAAFSPFVRIFLDGLRGISHTWQGTIWILAVLTMTVGNMIAISQSNIKRMLAYSSIAHAGYLLVAMVAGGEMAGSAILFYLLAYGLMSLGAFSVVLALGEAGNGHEEIDEYAGLGVRHPFLGVAMAIFMLSFIGVPPLGGFTGKFYLFASAVEGGFLGLAVIGVLNSAVSVAYYLRVVVMMYMRQGGLQSAALRQRPLLFLTMTSSALGTLYLGLFPQRFFEIARSAFLSLGS
jgi:NADH-quinone oxidoreductase subunit N